MACAHFLFLSLSLSLQWVKSNKVVFDWWSSRRWVLPAGPLACMSCGNGSRLLRLNTGGSLEPIKYRWWWSDCSVRPERQGSAPWTHRTHPKHSQTDAERVLINPVISVLIFDWIGSLMISILSPRHCTGTNPQHLIRGGFCATWLLIIMHVKTATDLNKAWSSSNTCPVYTGVKLPWLVFPRGELKWIINQ